MFEEYQKSTARPASETILKLIPSNKKPFLKSLLLINEAKKSWANLDPPTRMAVSKPTCIDFPPASIIMAGMMVSTSMKFFARARKTACHKKNL